MESIKDRLGDRASLLSSAKYHANHLQQYAKGKESLGIPFLLAFDLSGRIFSMGIGDCMGPDRRDGIARVRHLMRTLGCVRVVAFTECWVIRRHEFVPNQKPPRECADRQEMLWCMAQDIHHKPTGFLYEIRRHTGGVIESFAPLVDLESGEALKYPEFLDRE